MPLLLRPPRAPRIAITATLPALLACGLAFAAPAEAPALRKIGEWHLQQRRQGCAAAAIGDNIYIVAGGSRDLLSDIERFNVRTHTTERCFDQLRARRYHSVVEFDGHLFIFGGEGITSGSQLYDEAVEIYDPIKQTVTRGRDLPVPRSHMAAARVGDKAYLIGGKKQHDGRIVHTGEMDIYDLRANTWSRGPAMPVGREAPAAVVTESIIVPAGFRGKQRCADVSLFVTRENGWRELPPIAPAVSAHSVGVLDRWLFLFGDYDDFSSVLAYDWKTHETSKVATAFRGARHTAAVVVDNVIYVIGGNRDVDRDESDLIEGFALVASSR